MNRFRRLMLIALCSGALAGLVLFAIQHYTVTPLIMAAETIETDAHQDGHAHEDEGWRPANGWQRTSLTAIATILGGIGFAAILFGTATIAGKLLNAWHGALWGLAAFVCCDLAPALGLPPQPPGAAVADVHERQLWWVGTAVATAAGLWLLADRDRSWPFRVAGVLLLALPHFIGAPVAHGQNAVPAQLIHQFTIASLATTAVFWIVLGTVGGLIHSRNVLT